MKPKTKQERKKSALRQSRRNFETIWEKSPRRCSSSQTWMAKRQKQMLLHNKESGGLSRHLVQSPWGESCVTKRNFPKILFYKLFLKKLKLLNSLCYVYCHYFLWLLILPLLIASMIQTFLTKEISYAGEKRFCLSEVLCWGIKQYCAIKYCTIAYYWAILHAHSQRKARSKTRSENVTVCELFCFSLAILAAVETLLVVDHTQYKLPIVK